MKPSMLLASLLLAWSWCCPWSLRCDAGGPTDAPSGQPREVEFFAALDSGEIQAMVVPQSFSLLTLRVQNQTPNALTVRLPDSLAALPAARRRAQEQLLQHGLPPSLAHSYPSPQGSSQGLGFSLAGPWADQRAGTPAASTAIPRGHQDTQTPRTWSLAPGEMVQLQVPCFCLEYGRPDPSRHIPYQLVPLQDLNRQPAVAELLQRFGQGSVDQRVAQLAAWHLASGVPWPMLARVKLPQSVGRAAGAVTRSELWAAQQLCGTLPAYGESPSLGSLGRTAPRESTP